MKKGSREKDTKSLFIEREISKKVLFMFFRSFIKFPIKNKPQRRVQNRSDLSRIGALFHCLPLDIHKHCHLNSVRAKTIHGHMSANEEANWIEIKNWWSKFLVTIEKSGLLCRKILTCALGKTEGEPRSRCKWKFSWTAEMLHVVLTLLWIWLEICCF